MHIVISRFTRPSGENAASLKEKFEASAPIYRDLDGLIVKYYLMGTDQDDAGGVYVFASREDADAWFTEDKIAWAIERFGQIKLEHYDVPISLTTTPPEIIDHKKDLS